MEENIKFKWQWQILESNLPSPAKHILLTMSIYMNPAADNCYPSIAKLSTSTGLSANTVRKHIRFTIKKKYLKAQNAGFRGAKTQQMKYFPIINETGVQEMKASKRGAVPEGLSGERGSAGEQRGSGGEPEHIINNKRIKTFLPDSIEIRLSRKLFSAIQKRDPENKKPDLQKWAKHIDLLIRKDNRQPETIAKVVDWCQQDDFWQNNILSTEKLRKQFNQLFLKMNQGNYQKERGPVL